MSALPLGKLDTIAYPNHASFSRDQQLRFGSFLFMAITTKKGSKTRKTKQLRPKMKTSVAEQAQANAELRQQLAESLQREKATAEELPNWKRQFTEAFEQQTATSEILRVISESPTDTQPVFDTIARSAMRLCDAAMGVVSRYDGELIHLAAHSHVATEGAEVMQRIFPMHPARTGIHGRIIQERGVVHIPDAQVDAEYSQPLSQALHLRSAVDVPMIREGRVRRSSPELLGFTEDHALAGVININ